MNTLTYKFPSWSHATISKPIVEQLSSKLSLSIMIESPICSPSKLKEPLLNSYGKRIEISLILFVEHKNASTVYGEASAISIAWISWMTPITEYTSDFCIYTSTLSSETFVASVKSLSKVMV